MKIRNNPFSVPERLTAFSAYQDEEAEISGKRF